MSYNGSGTFNINTAGQPVVTGTTITSTAFNLLTADLATGLSTALTKDGQTTPTANIPLGGFKITGLGAGTAATDAAQYGQLQAGATTIATVTGTDTYVGTLSPAIAAYATGNLFSFVAPNTNTGAATINLNSLGAKNITKLGSTALAAGDIVSGRVYQIEYDGTRFQLLNPSASTVASFSAGSTGFTPSSATTGAVTLAGTLATTNGGTGLTSFTANGVVYASSSSALATGSALVFDGTNLGVANSSPSDAVTVGTTTTGKNIRIYSSSNGNNGLLRMFDSGNTERLQLSVNTTGEAVYYSPTSSVHAWYINTEQMRLTSTGLGIGTSSPTTKLDVVGSGDGEVRIRAGSDAALIFSETAANKNWKLKPSAGDFLWQYSSTAYNSGYSNLMTLNSSGNLGLGVTPSAWATFTSVLQNQGGAIACSGVNNIRVFQNSYYNGTNYIYKTTEAASRYDQQQGAHAWFTAASGTAGNAITFTQAMTLDASGNLGIGTTSPAAKLNISGGDAYFYNTATYGGIRIGYDGSNYWSIQRENASTGRLGFFNGASEKVSIDTSGNLLVGTTSGNSSIIQKNTDSSYATVRFISACATTSNQYGPTVELNGDPNNTSQYLLACRGGVNGTTDRCVIRSNGGIANYQANDVNLSDRREKTNFAPAKSYLDVICAIPVQTFNYVDQNMEEDGGLTLGVVAQDVQAVAPELIAESNWGTEEEPKMRLSIYQTDLQYALMKALQELKAEFDAYKASHP
jgi:hypothetical protein